MIKYIILSSLLGASAIAQEPTEKQREFLCTSIFQSYFDGCWQVYLGGTYTDEEAKGITATCVTKSKAYTKANTQCKDVKFDDEP